jgi:hypothetical protein
MGRKRTQRSRIADHAEPHPLLGAVLKRLDHFADDWASVWARFETDEAGRPDYVELLTALKRDLATLGGSGIVLKNQWPLYTVLDQMVLMNLFADPTTVMTRASSTRTPERLAS